MAQIPQRSNPLVDASSILSNLAPLFLGSGKSTQTVSSQSLDNGSIEKLKQILGGQDFSKGAAISDSNAAVNNAVRKVLEGNLGQIGSAQSGAGVYNSSTTQQLTNDLVSRAAAEGSQLQLNNIAKYADIQNNAANTLKGSVLNETKTTQTGPMIENPLTAVLKGVGLLAAGSLGSKALGAGSNALTGLFNSLFEDSSSGSSSDAPPNVSLGPNPFKNKSKGFGSSDSTDTSGFGAAADLITPNFSDIGKGAIDSFTPSQGASQDFAQSLNEAFGKSNSNSVINSLFGSDFGNGGGGSNGASIGSDGNSVSASFDFGSLFKGCFITTAVCDYYGFPDDCVELNTLRHFRDTYMRSTPEMQAKISQYYKEAPRIVAVLARLSSDMREQIYTEMYETYIVPALAAINSDKPAVAYSIYSSLFGFAKEIASNYVTVDQIEE
jgi:hypothetical protein